MSIEEAKALLEAAARAEDPAGLSTAEQWAAGRERAAQLRLEASVLAVAALIERLDTPPQQLPSEPSLRRCAFCGVQVYAGHAYHRGDCPKVEKIRCAHCHGSGSGWGMDACKPCSACGGAGFVR